jgi:hypothetical protein
MKFVFQEFGGIKPAFYVHIAHPPRNRSLIIQKEVRKAYFRIAQALILQPGIKGIMCATWLHDPVAMEMYPHLGPLNEPYLNLGGKLVTNLGAAPPESGFTKQFQPAHSHERGKVTFKCPGNVAAKTDQWAQQNRSRVTQGVSASSSPAAPKAAKQTEAAPFCPGSATIRRRQ